MKGIVKWFNTRKGFGFIEYKDNEDIFVHFTCIESDEKFKYLVKGEEVEFYLKKTDKGFCVDKLIKAPKKIKNKNHKKL